MSKTKSAKEKKNEAYGPVGKKSNIPTAAELENKLVIVKASVDGAAAVTQAMPKNVAMAFGPSQADIDAYKTAEAQGKVKKLTNPPFVRPLDVGPGVIICGTIKDCVDSTHPTFKGRTLVLEHSNGREFTWPLNAVTKSALARYQKGGQAKSEDLDDSKLVGIKLYIAGLGSKKHSDGQRDVRLFDIRVLE